MNFAEHCLELVLKLLIFCSLIELANKMTADFERVKGEIKCGAAQVL